MSATLGSVITDEKPDEPARLERLDRQSLRRQLPRAAARDLDRPAVDPLEKLGRVAGDEIDDTRFQRRARRQAGGLANGLLGPVGVAPAQLGQTADEGHGVVGRLRRHRVFRHRRRRRVFSLLAVAAVLLSRSLGSAGSPGSGPPISTGVAAPRLVPGAMAATWVA